MTYLTASGTSAGLCFAYRVAREVVLVHISLCFFLVETVDALSVAYRTESSDSEDLSLTSCEETRSVYAGENSGLGSKRTNLVDTSAVNALALVEPVADYLLLELVDALVDHSDLLGVLLIEISVDIVNDRSKALVADVLIICVKSDLYAVSSESLDSVEHIVVNFH